MARTPSTMLPLGTLLPQAHVQNLDGSPFDWTSLYGKPMVVVFLCNHCPFVKHILPVFTQLAANYRHRFQFLAINSNDVHLHPEDGPDEMAKLKADLRWDFPFVFDYSQEAAKAFEAACTPDFYLFDSTRHLVYRGQFDDSRPGNTTPVTGKDLKAALDALLMDKLPTTEQIPSLGCNIKWTPGNEPDYFKNPAK